MATADDLIAEALNAPVRGWDFSWLDGRAEEARPPWDYSAIVREAAVSTRRLLDVDTGGGEFLTSLAPVLGSIVATEGYAPNVAIAHERLSPLGIQVVETASAPDNVEQGGTNPESSRSGLPFTSDAFDLVIDRHSSYWPSKSPSCPAPRWSVRDAAAERVEDQRDRLGGSLGRPPHAHQRFDRTFAVGQLADAGFDVDRAEEADTPMTFHDLGAVVYYLRIVPWAVEGFDPTGDRETLERMHRLITDEGALRIRGSHMLLDARAR